EYVVRNSRLTLDRLSPTNEIWFSIRREGFAFCGELISKREFTEKNLNKGELRPEIAYLMCCFAKLQKDDVVLEPFCGYGAIPMQLAKRFSCQKIYVSDIDEEKVKALQEKKALRQAQGPRAVQGAQLDIRRADAFELSHIPDVSIDAIITDPPWGLWENIPDIEDFYNRMFVSFKRVLKPDGKMTILTARTVEFEKVVQNAGLKITDSLHTLVNGKKASLYVIASEAWQSSK
ncbi:MAG: methyltransferase, partial [Treponema sp.]|nr:methyltransferase [Treponema sp.]